jgi:hypothetical protein
MHTSHASKPTSDSLIRHSTRVFALESTTSTRFRKLESELSVLRTSLEAFKQHIYSQLGRQEKELQDSLASCFSTLCLEGKELVTEREQRLEQISLLEADLSGLYVQMKGCIQRVQRLEQLI